MRDGTGVMGAQADMLQRAERAISEGAADERGPELRAELLRGNLEELIAKIRMRGRFGGRAGQSRCPGEPDVAPPDFVVDMDGSECRFVVIALDGELVLLEDNDHSIMRQEAIYEQRRAMTREIVARVSERIGRMPGRNKQAVAIVWDPMRTIARHGDLGGALRELGRGFPWLSAVIVANDGEFEVHDVPGSTNALDGDAREAILRAAPGPAGPRHGGPAR